MTPPVNLSELAEAMELQSDFDQSFLHQETGKIYSFSEEELSAAELKEPLEEFPEWQREIIVEARAYLEHEKDYIALPDKFEIHEWSLMESFSAGIEAAEIREQLLSSLKGKGAFRRFKDTAARLGVIERWYTYRADALVDIAREWCLDHGITYSESENSDGS